MAIINELVTKFSFQGSTKPLSTFNTNLTRSITLLGGMTAAIATSAIFATKWVTGVSQAADSLIRLSRQTGVAIEFIQEMGYAASVTGSSIEAVESSIASLSKKIGAASIKGDADFSRLGINIRNAYGEIKNADVILGEVQQRFRDLGLTLEQQRSFADSLGIDSSLVLLMNKTNKEMKELSMQSKGFAILTKDQADQIAKYNDSLQALKFSFTGIKRLIAVELAPELTNLANSFSGLLQENKDSIIGGVQKSMDLLGSFVEMIGRVKWAIAGLATAFVGFKVFAVGLGAIMAGIFSPIALTIAGIVSTLAIVDSVAVGMQGGDSAVLNTFDDLFGSNGLFAGGLTMSPQGGALTGGSVTQNVNIDVHGRDAEAIGRAIGNTLQRQLDIAKDQVDKGVR